MTTALTIGAIIAIVCVFGAAVAGVMVGASIMGVDTGGSGPSTPDVPRAEFDALAERVTSESERQDATIAHALDNTRRIIALEGGQPPPPPPLYKPLIQPASGQKPGDSVLVTIRADPRNATGKVLFVASGQPEQDAGRELTKSFVLPVSIEAWHVNDRQRESAAVKVEYTKEPDDPDPGGFGMAAKVESWVRMDVPQDQWAKCPAMAASYAKAASDLRSGAVGTVGVARTQIFARNRQIISAADRPKWDEWKHKFVSEVNNMEDTRVVSITDLPAFARLYDEVAQGFRRIVP